MYQHILICFRMHGKLGWTCIFFSSDSVNPLVDSYISYFESNKRVALPHLSCDHYRSRYLFRDSSPELLDEFSLGRPTIPMSSTLNLNCLVLGDDASRTFPIKIAKSDTVGDLRKLIKEENTPAFDHVPTNTLVLWKVSILVNRSLTENLSNRTFGDESPLLPVDELSEVFSDSPARRHLHIVVSAPPASECE